VTATDVEETKFVKANNEAIAIIIPCLNSCCYNKVVNKETIDSAYLLWEKISTQYASHSVVNQGRVYMKWSNLTYSGDLQEYIDKTRSSLLDIESVNIIIPKELVLYLVLGKLLNQDLDQIVDRIALSPDCTKDRYLVLNALQTFHTHKLNKASESASASALATSTTNPKFTSKVVHYCGGGDNNPLATTHSEP
jgi:hypothetical protein